MTILALENVVKVDKEAVITTSEIVAEVFEKQHKHVLRHIESLMKDSEGLALGFEGCTYLDGKGRTQKMYNINRDGFMLLIFGFTGEKAKAIKLSFIEAFNKMEEHIRSQKQTIYNPTRLEFAQMLVVAEEERAKLEQHNAVLEHTVGHYAPKVAAYDHVIDPEGHYGLQMAGKVLPTSWQLRRGYNLHTAQ